MPVSPYDNALAIDQMEAAYTTLISRAVPVKEEAAPSRFAKLAKDGKDHPKIVTLGGDHTIVSTFASLTFCSFLLTWVMLGSSDIEGVE